MRKQKKRLCLAAVLLSVSTALTASCAGSPKVEHVLTAIAVPAFPAFPAPDPVTLDEETETVSMPLWYWQKVAEYKIGVDAVEAYLKKAGEAAREKNKSD
jgi:hypothetical protein